MVHYHIFEDFNGIAGVALVMHFILQLSYKWLFHGEIILIMSSDSILMK